MRHFLEIADWSASELDQLLRLAVQLKLEWQSGGNRPVLGGKVLGMIFQKPSLRTRVSFDVAMLHLGGHALYISPSESGLGQRESIADVARVLSSMTQGIMARVFDPAHITELARWSSVPVINGLSDRSHPCQAMADVLTLYEHFGHLAGLKLAYVGDSNNVTRSLAESAVRFGMCMSVASPPGYQLKREAVDEISAMGLDLQLTDNPALAVDGADVVYTDTWTSMGQEAETEKRKAVFPPFQVNAALLAHARPDSIVMHCLPAHRGQELTDEVMDGPQSVVFPQAENRMHAQKAILVELLAKSDAW
jgi:ornithine carbamoyltransferase